MSVVAGWRTRVGIGVVVLLAVLARVPFLGDPLGADEGGFLLVASQWSPGSSLYGDYWVDRPPLLIEFFALVHALGGVTALRLLGMALVVVSVLLAARVGRLVGGSALTCAAVAGLFLTTPLFGALEVNGEQVAAPLVLGGVALALQASRTPSARLRAVLLVATGAVGAAAVLVKQNEIDVAVVALVGGLTFLRGGQRHAPWRTWGLVLLGALATTAVVLADAVRRGTDLVALFHAVVTFRLDAAAVISASAPSTNTERFWGVLGALVGSGAPVLVVMLVVLGVRARGRTATPLAGLGWTTGALLAWESTSVLAGGSYWLHYLLCLVPGLVLSTAIITTSRVPALQLRGARLPATGLLVAFATFSCVVSLAAIHQRPDLTGHETSPVIAWLDAHKRPGDTAVVAFGRPDYLVETGLRSPYSELWSLPVRVRDPDLVGFSKVLASPRRPTWIITNGAGTLGSWGIDDDRAEPLFTRHYQRAVDLGDRQIFVRRSRAATLPQ